MKLGIFRAQGGCKPLPADTKAEAPILTAALCSTVTALMSGGGDKTYPAGLFCSPSPVPPESWKESIVTASVGRGKQAQRGGSCPR